jgi:hypothetical protein
MLARLFRSNRPAVLLALFVLVPMVFVPGIWRMGLLPGKAMPLYQGVVQLSQGASWLPGLLGLFVVALCAVQLAFLTNDAELLGPRTHLPALLFPLLLGVLSGGRVLEPALLGMPFVLAAMGRVWSIATAPKVLGRLFDAGLLLGIAALVHLPYAFLIVVIWASVSVIRPFQWREYVLPVVGVALALYLAWAFHILFTDAPWSPLKTVIGGASADMRSAGLPKAMRWGLNAVMYIMAAVSVKVYLESYMRGVMREKNLRASFMALFFALVVLVAGAKVLEGSFPAVLLAAPLAVFLSHALRGTRRAWLTEGAVLLLLLAALLALWG